MARPTIEVDRNRLTSIINILEQGGPLVNQSLLFSEASKRYNEGLEGLKPIEPGVVRLRVMAWNLEIKTPRGKRGRSGPMPMEHKAKMIAGRHSGGNRKAKLRANPRFDEAVKALKARTPIRLHVLVKEATQGSLKAAVKLMCNQCMGHDNAPHYIRTCTSLACPLYLFRPYQKQPGTVAAAETAA